MLSKLILTASVLCVLVQAAFIINAPSDGDKDVNEISENAVVINKNSNKANDVITKEAHDYTIGQISSEKISGSDAATGFASARACTNAICNRFCLSRGYHFGRCISDNICRCYRFLA